MNTAATNAETVLNNWFLRPTGMDRRNVPNAEKRIPAGSCPRFPADPAAPAEPSPPADVPIHTPEDFPERPDSQPWAVSNGEKPFLRK